MSELHRLHFKFSHKIGRSTLGRWLEVLLGLFYTNIGVTATLQEQSVIMGKDPKQVILIRHGEKEGFGQGPSSPASSPHLNYWGQRRALALAEFLPKSNLRPDFLIAPKPNNKSQRSYETLLPLAQKLGMKIYMKHDNEEWEKIVKEVMKEDKYERKTVLIAWNHSDIPHLAEQMKGRGIPKHWPEATFDRFWRLDYSLDKPIFTSMPQRLLPGDAQY